MESPGLEDLPVVTTLLVYLLLLDDVGQELEVCVVPAGSDDGRVVDLQDSADLSEPRQAAVGAESVGCHDDAPVILHGQHGATGGHGRLGHLLGTLRLGSVGEIMETLNIRAMGPQRRTLVVLEHYNSLSVVLKTGNQGIAVRITHKTKQINRKSFKRLHSGDVDSVRGSHFCNSHLPPLV